MSIKDVVKEKYGQVAASALSNRDEGVRKVAEAFGYLADELSSIPAGANLGLSCGNPLATASLRPGEVVVDLGCGAGLDVFLAAARVGPTGRAIGIDMTHEMIVRAKKNAAEAKLGQVEFHEASIDKLPLRDNSVDCIISNCVINLAPDKEPVFREMFRVLKPGGRVAVSDIALKRKLPHDLAADLQAYVGCIAGAISIPEYERGLHSAGFGTVHVVPTGADLNVYRNVEGQCACCSPTTEGEEAVIQVTRFSRGGVSKQEGAALRANVTAPLARYDLNDLAASVNVYAVKPDEA